MMDTYMSMGQDLNHVPMDVVEDVVMRWNKSNIINSRNAEYSLSNFTYRIFYSM